MYRSEKKPKLLIYILLVIGLILPSSTYAAEDDTFCVLYQADEIVDIDKLIIRAEHGINEYTENTGRRLDFNVEKNDNSEQDILEYKSYVTSQLLKRELINGHVRDTYVATSIVTYYTNAHSAYKSGSTLASRIYLYVYSDARFEIKLKYTNSAVTGGGQRLVMTNIVQMSAAGAQYTNGRTIANPSGGYNLSPASSAINIWVTSTTGLCGLNDTLFFSNGTSCNVHFAVTTRFNEVNL